MNKWTQQRAALTSFLAWSLMLLIIGGGIVLGGQFLGADDPAQPPDACREAATALYGHVGAMFDQITQEALIQGGHTGHYGIHSDGEVFPRVWYDFVTACVPPLPPETGTS